MCKYVNILFLDDSLFFEGLVLLVRIFFCEDRVVGVIKVLFMVLFVIIIGFVIIILFVKFELIGVFDNNSEVIFVSVIVVMFVK